MSDERKPLHTYYPSGGVYPLDFEHDIVIVGAGPVGLASAIGFVQRGYSVLVIEKLKDPCLVDQAKSYCYRVDVRGRKCLKRVQRVPSKIDATTNSGNGDNHN